jgi:hypothetical protein
VPCLQSLKLIFKNWIDEIQKSKKWAPNLLRFL